MTSKTDHLPPAREVHEAHEPHAPHEPPAGVPSTDSDRARRIERVRFELRRRDVRVVRVQRLSPGFVSVTFADESLRDFASLSFDDHVKFMFQDADGQWVRRDYTPLHHDAARGELTIEFALHAHGPASDWARQAAPGQMAALGGPRGSMVVPLDFDWHLLAGDASALPAIARRLGELPGGARAIVLVEVADPADRRAFDTRADVRLQWVPDSPAWLHALRELRLPAGEGFAWCAGQAQVMRQARETLMAHHGHPREQLKVAAYWKPGAADFHERLDD